MKHNYCFLIIAVALYLSACNNIKTSDKTSDTLLLLDKKGNQDIPVGVKFFIDSFFTEHRNWNNNDATRDITSKSLTEATIPVIKNGFYNDLPFRLGQVDEYTDKSGYLAKFEYKHESDDKKVIVSILASLSKQALDTLKEGNLYKLNGNVNKILMRAVIFNDGLVPTIALPMVEFNSVKIRSAEIND